MFYSGLVKRYREKIAVRENSYLFDYKTNKTNQTIKQKLFFLEK